SWQKSRQITSPKSSRRNSRDVSLCLTHALPFIIGKEKQFVLAVEKLRNHHRPAQIRAKLIHAKWRNRTRSRIKKVLRIKGRVAHELIRRAMKIIRAGAESDIDHRRPAAVSRGSSIRLHLKLLNRINWRIKDQYIRIGIDTLNSIEQINPNVRRIPVNGSPT